MSVQLVSLGEGPSIVLDKPILLFGRDQECDIRLDSRKISRRHCCLAQVGDQLVIRDLASTNGVRVNGVRVVEGYLKGGDELTIGNHRYKVSWEALPGGKEKANEKMHEMEPANPRLNPVPQDDDVLESFDEPVPLADGPGPAAGRKEVLRPPSPPPVNKAPSVNFEPDLIPGPPAVKMTFSDLLPEDINLAPPSDLFPPPSPPPKPKS